MTDLTLPGALMPPQVIEPMPPEPPQKNPAMELLTQVEGMQRSSQPALRASASMVPSRAPGSTRTTPSGVSSRIRSSRARSSTTPPNSGTHWP